MTKQLKLEVGKRYTMRSGAVVFIYSKSRINGFFIGAVAHGVSNMWEGDGTSVHEDGLDLVACLDDEPELVDLTKIDVPFGGLDERTQDRLAGAAARGCAVEFKGQRDGAWQSTSASPSGWRVDFYYRLRPTYTMPTVDDKVWLAMPGAKAIAWDDGVLFAHAFTEVPTPLHAEWARGDGYALSLLREALPLHHEFFGDLIKRGDCPWDQAIVLRPEGL